MGLLIPIGLAECLVQAAGFYPGWKFYQFPEFMVPIAVGFFWSILLAWGGRALFYGWPRGPRRMELVAASLVGYVVSPCLFLKYQGVDLGEFLSEWDSRVGPFDLPFVLELGLGIWWGVCLAMLHYKPRVAGPRLAGRISLGIGFAAAALGVVLRVISLAYVGFARRC